MRTLWEGNVPLVKVFWQWGVLGRVILGIPVFFIGFLVARGAFFSPGAISIIVVYDLLVFAYVVFISVAIWRSAGKYQGPKRWTILARFAVVMLVAANINAINKILLTSMDI